MPKNEYEDFRKQITDDIGELSESLIIDKFDLDSVCEQHAVLYFQAATILAKADGMKHRADAKVQEAKARIANEIREQREEDGLKTTDKMIFELVDSSDEMQELRWDRALANENYAFASAILNSYEHRRSMINNEVQLLITNVSRSVGESKMNAMDKHYSEKEKYIDEQDEQEIPKRRRRVKKTS